MLGAALMALQRASWIQPPDIQDVATIQAQAVPRGLPIWWGSRPVPRQIQKGRTRATTREAPRSLCALCSRRAGRAGDRETESVPGRYWS